MSLIRTEAELALRRSRGEAEYKESFRHILLEAERTTSLIETFREFVEFSLGLFAECLALGLDFTLGSRSFRICSVRDTATIEKERLQRWGPKRRRADRPLPAQIRRPMMNRFVQDLSRSTVFTTGNNRQ